MFRPHAAGPHGPHGPFGPHVPVMGCQRDIGRVSRGAAGGVNSDDIFHVNAGVLTQRRCGGQAFPNVVLFRKGQLRNIRKGFDVISFDTGRSIFFPV